MAYDGIITAAMAEELNRLLSMGKIDKIGQPLRDRLVFTVHTKNGNLKLLASSGSSDPRVHITEENLPNPPEPPPFCMLLRKHLVGARIVSVSQVGSDRIMEMFFEAMNELGFTVSKKLVFEIMGKHSNIILVDTESNKVIDSIKRVSFDTSRARQILPGVEYAYPPSQDKIPFSEVTEDQLAGLPGESDVILKTIGGISPQVAESMATIIQDEVITDGKIKTSTLKKHLTEYGAPHIYMDQGNNPVDFHVMELAQYEPSLGRVDFPDLSKCIEYYFDHKDVAGRKRQMSHDIYRKVTALLEKNQHKLQKLYEDLHTAENADTFRLYGELLTANLHLVSPGSKEVEVVSYYDGSKVLIPLDPKYSPSKNAQMYYKKYGKAKTAVKEKKVQIQDTQVDITYLESVLQNLNEADTPDEIEAVRTELAEAGYIRNKRHEKRPRKAKISPRKYISPSGFEILVGHNNKENDELTLKLADKTDTWLHTKDIPGSHVILRTRGEDPSSDDIYCAASVAAYFSKAKDSGQVPVDYVKVRYVKKPAGAKPGMVIFTNNHTVYVEPKLPD